MCRWDRRSALCCFSVPLLVAAQLPGGSHHDHNQTLFPYFRCQQRRSGLVCSRPPKLSACQPAAKPYFAPECVCVFVCVCGASTFAVSPELLNRKGRIAAYFQRSYGNGLLLAPVYMSPILKGKRKERKGATNR